MDISMRPLTFHKANANYIGSTLLLVMIFSSILALIALSALRLTLMQSRMSGRSHAFEQAMATAEAGVERAIREMNKGTISGSSWNQTEALSNASGNVVGHFRVDITGASGSTPMIESTGFIPNIIKPKVKRTVRVTLQQNTNPPWFKWAIYSKDYLKFGSDYFVDSYDSSLGPYPGTGKGNTNANIGGNTYGDFSGNINVYGSLQLGGGLVSNMPSIYGDDADGNHNVLLENNTPTPPPTFPDADLANAQANNDNALITINGSSAGSGTTLYADSDAVVIIPPGIYYYTEIEMGSKVKVKVEPAGEVKIYMKASSEGDYALKIGSDLQLNTNTTHPTNLTFFIKQGKVEIQSYAEIYAAFFAPNSDIIIQSDLNFWGALFGNTVELQSNENIHYDEALGKPSGGGGGVFVTAWNEITPVY